MRDNNSDASLESRGPWSFDNPEIQPGDSWRLDFRQKTYNGRKRYFKPFLPLDEAQVTNRNSGQSVDVTFNADYRIGVEPNAVESFSEQGVTYLSVAVPAGGTTVAAGDLSVAVATTAYDADDAAREDVRQDPVSEVVEEVTGVRPW